MCRYASSVFILINLRSVGTRKKNIVHLFCDLISLFSIFIDAAEATGKGGDYSVPKGKSKLFSCPVDGNPEPNITWYKDTAMGSFGPEISTAKQLETSETGCYICSGSNSLGPPVNIKQCLVGKIISLLYHFL